MRVSEEFVDSESRGNHDFQNSTEEKIVDSEIKLLGFRVEGLSGDIHNLRRSSWIVTLRLSEFLK